MELGKQMRTAIYNYGKGRKGIVRTTKYHDLLEKRWEEPKLSCPSCKGEVRFMTHPSGPYFRHIDVGCGK